jgi:LacI family transcriptional regulator
VGPPRDLQNGASMTVAEGNGPVDGTEQITPAFTGRATVVDVARLARVSGRTVSRVLAGDGNVSDQTRERVQQAAATLRFRPNRLARELRTGGVSTTIGFIVGDLTNEFYAHVAAGVESVLTGRGMTMLLAATRDDPELEPLAVAAMLEHRVQALLFVPVGADHSYLEHEYRMGTPVVAVDRPATNLETDTVVFDNRGGAVEAVRALVTRGHRRIAFIGSDRTIYTHEQRLAGYADALAQAGIDLDPTLIRRDAADRDSAERAARDLFARAEPPTAAFVANNVAAQGVLPVAQKLPEPIAIIVFDDFNYAATLDISVISHDPYAMGREAATLALSRLADPGRAPVLVTLPTRLLRRGSAEFGFAMPPEVTRSARYAQPENDHVAH